MKVQVIMLLACICAVSADDSYDWMIKGMSTTFKISENQVEECVNETQPTANDVVEFIQSVSNPSPTVQNEENKRRAMCALACLAEKSGLMIGTNLQMDKIHEELDDRKFSKEGGSIIHEYADACAEEVQNYIDECMVGPAFIKCIMKKYE